MNPHLSSVQFRTFDVAEFAKNSDPLRVNVGRFCIFRYFFGWLAGRCLRSILIAGMIAFAGQALANDTVPPAPQSKPILFTGATVHSVSGAAIKNGKVLVIDGKISKVGGPDLKINLPQGTVTLDLAGKHLYPGMIAANSVLGLTEINAVRATADMAEPGELNPNARAQVSINPDSELIPVARANGVLATLAIPRGGLIAGSSALVRLDGWTWEDMTVQAPVGMHIYWPQLRTVSKWTSTTDDTEIEKLRKDYESKVEKITDAFDQARAYAKAVAARNFQPKSDLRWQALLPVLDGKVPVFLHAESVAQIRGALHFARSMELQQPVIVGGADAWRVIDELRASDAAVILSPVNSLPARRWEAYDTPYVAAKKLHDAGISFCLANSGSAFDSSNERNLPYQAGRAAAFGLPRDVALKSVTLFAAQILGVGDRLGSIEAGKEATFFVSDGDPLEVMTQVERAWIRGREVDLSSKHTQLYEKYQEKYRQLNGE
jgi:imidazolonepropionase-like amidohydrolase